MFGLKAKLTELKIAIGRCKKDAEHEAAKAMLTEIAAQKLPTIAICQ